MNDLSRRINSIVVKNLPVDCNESQLEDLFSKFGCITSTKILPANANFPGACGFVNFSDRESCNHAVEMMDNVLVNGYCIRVGHSATRENSNHSEKSFNGLRSNNVDNRRESFTSPDEHQNNSSPNTLHRFNGFRSGFERLSMSSTSPKSNGQNSLKTDTQSRIPTNTNRLWSRNDLPLNISEHDLMIKNKTYQIYLSNFELPNIIFAATVDDYLEATNLISQMNEHPNLRENNSNRIPTKLSVGQCCAALFNGEWYRARVLEIDEHRTFVQYVDWGNTNWCDSTEEIRSLPDEFYKNSVLCVKCILDGVSHDIKLTDETTNALLDLLALDAKLDMTIVRLENSVRYVQLKNGERNLNREIQDLIDPVDVPVIDELEPIEKNLPVMNTSEVYRVQLTTAADDCDSFHAFLMNESLATIMNVLKNGNSREDVLNSPPPINRLVCAQYEGDGLWYRAWIEDFVGDDYRVHFVDFGNREIVPFHHMTKCPTELRSIPWQSVRVRLNNIQLTNEERFKLLKKFETEKLDMVIVGQQNDIYLVDLAHRGVPLIDFIVQLREKKLIRPSPNTFYSMPPIKVENQWCIQEDQMSRPQSSLSQIEVSGKKSSTVEVVKAVPKSTVSSSTMTDPPMVCPSLTDESLRVLLKEQSRNNRLLEQVIASINTTNALLAQLVQRMSI